MRIHARMTLIIDVADDMPTTPDRMADAVVADLARMYGKTFHEMGVDADSDPIPCSVEVRYHGQTLGP